MLGRIPLGSRPVGNRLSGRRSGDQTPAIIARLRPRELPLFRQRRCQKADVGAGQAGRTGPSPRVQSTQSERRGGCWADENEPVIRRHGRVAWPGGIRGLLSCRWRCRGVRLSSSLSSEVSSAHGAKQRHFDRFLIPCDPALTIGCVKGGEAINVLTSSTPFTQPIEQSDTLG